MSTKSIIDNSSSVNSIKSDLSYIPILDDNSEYTLYPVDNSYKN